MSNLATQDYWNISLDVSGVINSNEFNPISVYDEYLATQFVEDPNSSLQGETYYINNSTGFKGAAYTQVDGNTVNVIIGFGCAEEGDYNDGLNNLAIANGQIPSQYYDAVAFYQGVSNTCQELFEGKTINISFTGWSLGGAIAQLMGKETGLTTITFSAAGMAYALGANGNPSSYTNITNYSILNDPVGGFGTHIGTSYVMPPFAVKTSVVNDVHRYLYENADFTHFIQLPNDWEEKYTIALVKYDVNTNWQDELQYFIFNASDFASTNEIDLKDAIEVVERNFGITSLLKETLRYQISEGQIIIGDSTGSETPLTGSEPLLGIGGNDSIYGNEGNDLIDGKGGDDTIFGGDDSDTIHGGSGNDVIYGASGDGSGETLSGTTGNYLYGDADNDIIWAGGAGSDYLDGGSGNDTLHAVGSHSCILIGGIGDDYLYSGTGSNNNDILQGGTGNDTYKVSAGTNVTITDSDGNGSIIAAGVTLSHARATDATNTVFTDNGGFTYTLSGNTLSVSGNDTNVTIDNYSNGNLGITLEDFNYNPPPEYNFISGTGASDFLVGTTGMDLIVGGGGNDYIIAGDGNDWIIADNSSIFGGNGDDLYGYCSEGPNYIEYISHDYIYDDSGNNSVSGDEYNTTNNTIIFGDGDDSIDGVTYSYINVGSGNNFVGNGNAHSTIIATGGTNRIQSSYSNITLGDGDDSIDSECSYDDINVGDGNNYIKGSYNTIIAGSGNDTILGDYQIANLGDGNNRTTSLTNSVITTSDGDDYFNSKCNHDTIYAGNGDNNFLLKYSEITAGDGNDSILGSYNTADLGDGNNYISGSYNTIVSGSGDDEIDSGVENSYIDLGGGNNYISGNNNTIYSGDGNDTADSCDSDLIYTGSGNDVISAYNSTIYSGADDDVVYDCNNDTICTEDGDDTVYYTGNSSINTGSGNDFIHDVGYSTIFAGSGNDIIHGIESSSIDAGDGNDVIDNVDSSTIYGGSGNNVISASNSSIYVGNGNNEIYNVGNSFIETGDGDNNIHNAGNCIIYTGAGDDEIHDLGFNTIYSGAGSDTIYNAGFDLIDTGEGDDVISSNYCNTITGGAGDDTYIMLDGNGTNIISDSSGNDKIILDGGINKGNVALYIDAGSNLILDYGSSLGSAQAIVLAQSSTPIERVQLSDGEYISNNDINQLIQNMTAYATANSIEFTNISSVKSNQDLMNLVASSWHS